MIDAQTRGFIDGLQRVEAEKRASILRGIKFMSALFETIKEAGPAGAPEGPMYAAVMAAGFSLEAFEGALALLAKRGLIRRSGHVAYYIPETTPSEEKH